MMTNFPQRYKQQMPVIQIDLVSSAMFSNALTPDLKMTSFQKQ